MTRGLVLLDRDPFGEWCLVFVQATLALVHCRGCVHRARLLPSDVLARKTYGLSVIEHACAEYVPGKQGLRAVVDSLLGPGPQHATLHAWTEGLGRHALGRDLGPRAFGDPFTAVLAEVRVHCPSSEPVLARASPLVDPRRYRSEPRRERLSALARLLLIAKALDEKKSDLPLCAWRRRVIGFALASPFSFPTGISRTAIERGVARKRQSPRRKPHSGDEKCPPRSRSPPGASS